MNLAIVNSTKKPKTNNSTAFLLSLVGAALLACILMLAYTSRPEGAIELQTAPWQTLLFIDISNNNL